MVGIREEEFGRELGGTKWEKSTGSSITEGRPAKLGEI